MSEKQYTPSAIEHEIDYQEGATKPIMDILDYYEENGNLASWYSDTQLQEYSGIVSQRITYDRLSMDEYIRKYENAIKLAKMEDEAGDKTFPFVGASRIMASTLLEAAIDFNSRVSPDIIGTNDICKIKVGGTDTMEKKELSLRGERVSTAVNTILTQKIRNWRDDKDRALVILPIVGTYFTKTWIDGYGEFQSKLIFADNLIFNHNSDSFDSADYKTHEFTLTKNELVSAIRDGSYYGIDEMKDLTEDKESYDFYECHGVLDLDDDGYCEPYIITFCKDTNGIVSIVPRFAEEDVILNSDNEVIRIKGEEFFDQTIFIPDPFGSCMGLGFGIILSDSYSTINTMSRQSIDAATLQITGSNSGFIRRGAIAGPRGGNRQRKGDVDMVMGKFTTVEGSGNNPLSQDIVNFPFGGLSQGFFTLLNTLKEEIKGFTHAGTGIEANAGEAAELYLARLQQGMKMPNSIMIRVQMGLSKELKRIYDLIRMYYTDEQYEELILEKGVVVEEDFNDDNAELITTADSSQGSEQERMAKASFALQEAKQNPQMLNLHDAYMRVFTAMGMPDINTLLVPPSNEPDQFQVMQQQYLQMQQQLEQQKLQIDTMNAQARLQDSETKRLELFGKVEKLQADVAKTNSETLLNGQELDLNQMEAVKKIFDEIQNLSEDNANALPTG